MTTTEPQASRVTWCHDSTETTIVRNGVTLKHHRVFVSCGLPDRSPLLAAFLYGPGNDGPYERLEDPVLTAEEGGKRFLIQGHAEADGEMVTYEHEYVDPASTGCTTCGG